MIFKILKWFLNVVVTNFMIQILFYYIYVYLTPHEESNMLYVDPNWLHTDCEFKAFSLIFPLAMRPYTTQKINS